MPVQSRCLKCRALTTAGSYCSAHRKQGRGSTRAQRKVRAAVIARDGHRCRSCARPGPLEVHHHLESFARGGAYVPENLLALCHACHVKTFV